KPSRQKNNIDLEPLIALIQSTIAPGTWRVIDQTGQEIMSESDPRAGDDQGETDLDRKPGKITPFFLSISLIIRHDAEVHDQLAEFLRKLRAAFTPPIDEEASKPGATVGGNGTSFRPKGRDEHSFGAAEAAQESPGAAPAGARRDRALRHRPAPDFRSRPSP